MNRKIFALFALTAGMHLAVHASENVNTTENRQFLKQQENLSRQLREKPDHQLKAWAEKQVLENPLQRSDNHFLDELVRKQQASQDGKPRQGALYFVSFSIPEEGLKRMLSETRHYGIPATLRGMVNNDLKATAACRYDTEGYVTEHISQEEEVYAAARLDKIRRQNRIKAELQAVLDEK
ncbi:TrbC family F-type conjugative pilus assembly protein [Escherichia coli]|uniref:TrbC family F-type conjugative pilus assembly protein n=1 Tax=Escherichia coli TaxID=562 RepID=UPI000453AD95|nr:TrbC family F-type conjugative pilus assembly protein [Escherichia coli]EZK07138.1 proQ/FINO family protein [Escherichia coli 2-005-03_S1_C3]EZK19841.1 proQ/FINO family protein [Escherichia coli 2-005-03_S1_C2]EZK35635.1 proQ/FINO family protein [Escherichia coli 2-005-03_S1_C1]KDA60499.1 proQ/FINO family protein [Escherichia coli 2-052-05_S1_C1]KDW11047.1 proQ/FINO family protein [Escherichia coli 2-177-06_S1_C1]